MNLIVDFYQNINKGLYFISNRQRRKKGTFGASELAGIERTPLAPEEQGMPTFIIIRKSRISNFQAISFWWIPPGWGRLATEWQRCRSNVKLGIVDFLMLRLFSAMRCWGCFRQCLSAAVEGKTKIRKVNRISSKCLFHNLIDINV